MSKQNQPSVSELLDVKRTGRDALLDALRHADPGNLETVAEQIRSTLRSSLPLKRPRRISAHELGR